MPDDFEQTLIRRPHYKPLSGEGRGEGILGAATARMAVGMPGMWEGEAGGVLPAEADDACLDYLGYDPATSRRAREQSKRFPGVRLWRMSLLPPATFVACIELSWDQGV